MKRMRPLIFLVALTIFDITGISQEVTSGDSRPVLSRATEVTQPVLEVTSKTSTSTTPVTSDADSQISKELGAAIIAGVGVLLSAVLSSLISYLTSSRLYSAEIRKLQFEAKKHYESKVVDNRIAVYPIAFALLSEAIKDIEFRQPSKASLNQLLEGLNAWDSKNSIFLSWDAGDALYVLRHKLKDHIADTKLGEQLKTSAFRDQLRDEIANVEMVLKSDIGIYGIESTKDGVFQPQLKTMKDVKKRVARRGS